MRSRLASLQIASTADWLLTWHSVQHALSRQCEIPVDCLHHCFLLLVLQVLACIGEQFDEGDEVCGVTVNIRAGKDRIELWTKTAANEALQMSIGKQLKQLLDIPDSNKIGFVVFVSTRLLCAAVPLACGVQLCAPGQLQWLHHAPTACQLDTCTASEVCFFKCTSCRVLNHLAVLHFPAL